MSEPPQENPAPDNPNKRFYLKMKPFVTFKRAIEALLDTNFSTGGLSMFRVDSDSLGIWVDHVDDVTDTVDATATLLLKSSGPSRTIVFQNNMLPPLMLQLLTPLYLISQRFPLDLNGDDDFVFLYHRYGTAELPIWFGNGVAPAPGYRITIEELPRYKNFPNLTVLGEITVPVSDITAMCECMERLPADDPCEMIQDGFVTFHIGRDGRWAYEYSQNERTFQVWFDWNFMTFMMEASSIADKARVLFLTVPEQHVLFQFHIGESADLFLLQKALFVITDEDDEDIVTLDTLSNSWLQ